MKDHRELGFDIARCRNITDLDQLRDENLEVLNAHPYLYRDLVQRPQEASHDPQDAICLYTDF